MVPTGSPRLLTAMVVVCSDLDLARELTAEAFARALERWDRVEIIRNCRLDLRCRRQPRPERWRLLLQLA